MKRLITLASGVVLSYVSTAAGFIQNRNRAAYTLAGTAYSGLAITPGTDTRGIGVGLVHKFRDHSRIPARPTRSRLKKCFKRQPIWGRS
jgi:hypothetical protein